MDVMPSIWGSSVVRSGPTGKRNRCDGCARRDDLFKRARDANRIVRCNYEAGEVTARQHILDLTVLMGRIELAVEYRCLITKFLGHFSSTPTYVAWLKAVLRRRRKEGDFFGLCVNGRSQSQRQPGADCQYF